MIPLFFGASVSPVYGVLHHAQEERRKHGVVLCCPFGQEYMRSHRAFRQLAFLLMRKGFDVLRFDYRGTGDSSGDPADFTADDWIQDIESAVDELRESTQVSSISIIGLRLGALLAAAAATKVEKVSHLILWDPVLSGSDYDTELLQSSLADIPNDRGVVAGNGNRPDGSLSYNGFIMSNKFRESIRNLRMPDLLSPRVARILEIVSHETPAFTEINTSGTKLPGFEYQLAPAPHDWNYVDDFGGILLPQPVIQAIVQWLNSSATEDITFGGSLS